MKRILSLQNPRVKQINKLRDKKGRESEKRFVIDYERDLERAVTCGYAIDYLFYCPALDHNDVTLPAAPVYEVSREIMEKLSYRENPSPVIAVIKQTQHKDVSYLHEISASYILGLVNLQKPGNIGALLRSADAAGFKAVLLIDIALDLYNPNIIRSSTGAVFLNNIYSISSATAIDFLHSKTYKIVAAAVEGEKSIFEVDFTQKSAVIMGTEDRGLDAHWLSQSSSRVRIPMEGVLSDSLNVSVSGALFMFEALRQRLVSS